MQHAEKKLKLRNIEMLCWELPGYCDKKKG